MTERSDVYAYFWVQGFDCSPAELSNALGLAPTSIETVRTTSSPVKPQMPNMWIYQSPLPRGDGLIQAYIESLLEALEPNRESVIAVARTYVAGINCVGYYYGSNPGLHLSAELIARMAALELPLDFDLYNYSESESAA